MNIITNPLTSYAVIAVCLTVTISLFLGLKYEFMRTKEKILKNQKDLEEQLRACQTLLEERREFAGAAIAKAVVPTAPVVVYQAEDADGMDLARRSQAIQLHRIGQRPEEIASALRLPKNEVDLLLKVHETVLSQAGAAKGFASVLR